jgi:ubiquinone/menaquinone biosynthesis C-methylase UbiE
MSFDRVAAIYDETRGLPAGIPEKVCDVIVDVSHATAETRFVELGVGTGRIALPLIDRGYDYTGVDISPQMMDKLRKKAGSRPNLHLIEADVTSLPLPDAGFDVAITVHLLHLVPDWKKTLAEVRRTLRPGGVYIEGSDGNLPNDPGSAMRSQWRAYVEEAGVTLRPEHGSRAYIEEDLTVQGCLLATYRVAAWEQSFCPLDALEEQQNRVFSASWVVPDDVLATVHEKMMAWARDRYGDLEQRVSSGAEFTLLTATFPT